MPSDPAPGTPNLTKPLSRKTTIEESGSQLETTLPPAIANDQPETGTHLLVGAVRWDIVKITYSKSCQIVIGYNQRRQNIVITFRDFKWYRELVFNHINVFSVVLSIL